MTTIDPHAGAHDHAPHDDSHHEGSYLEGKGSAWATIVDWATTVDHKKLGVMYLVASLTLFFVGGIAALAVRLELLSPPRIEHLATGEEVIKGTMFNLGHIAP